MTFGWNTMKNTDNISSNEEEKAILYSMIVDKDVIEPIRLVLNKEDFFYEDNKLIFKSICELTDEGSPSDLILIKKKLEALGVPSPLPLLQKILEGYMPTSGNYKFYIEQVKKSSVKRKLLKMAESVSNKVKGDIDTLEIVKFIEEEIVDATVDNAQKEAVSIKDGIASVLENIEKLRNDPKDISGIKTGIDGLDSKINGLNKTDLLILAARPGCGKSALALQIAKHTSFYEDKVTMLFSLEMGTDQLVQRTLCNDSKVDLWKIRSGKMDSLEMDALNSSARKLKTAPLFYNDMAAIGIKDIRSQIKLHNAKNNDKVDLVIVDYLQLMASGSNNLVQQVTEISRGLKMIAKEFNIPVLALSQLSRAVEARGGRPRLSDLRDSGSIEQDADIVMFLHRETKEEFSLTGDNVDLMVEKHRNGSTGDILLDFNGGKMTFTERFGEKNE